ncbi:MAG: LysM peptidoglycan-binding domain-containing protein [Bacilli bacterium]|nr:LysM peptidoglycan-binding domain-containing protein [Bacilli bacterium]
MTNNDYLRNLPDEEIEAIYKIRIEREKKEKENQEKIKKELENKHFKGRVKNALIEVKKEEKENCFSKRHEKLEKAAIDYYKEDEMFLSLKIGKVHVLGEALYQLDKLRIRKNDNIEKYTIRNRVLAVAIVISLILASANEIDKKRALAKEEQATIEEQLDNSINLTRYYTVQIGDTLSEISSETGININRIKNDNHITNPNMIYMNQKLQLNYSIDPENLEYYTKSVDVDGQSIYSIANVYQTDVNTLININGDAIDVKEDGTYQIISDKILVPEFITQQELNNALENNQK